VDRNGRSAGRTVEEEDVVVADVDLGLPEKKYFKIGEVASLLGVEAHVLRYWETQFPQLKPHKARSGHRLYRRREVETLLVIKDLLHVQRFTIAGARQAIRQQGTMSLLPRAAEQLTLPPTDSLQARHSRVLESTIPTEIGDADAEDAALDGDDDDTALSGDDDDDVLELHLADPLPRRAGRGGSAQEVEAIEAIEEVEVDVVGVDGEELTEALARQLVTQKNPNASVVPVEVRARSKAPGSTLPSPSRAAARASLLAAQTELEAFVARLKRSSADGRLKA
jgi:DNA-binding transcriptional MerR regulator